MTSSKMVDSEIFEKKLAELNLLVSDQITSQIEINCKLKADLDVMKLKLVELIPLKRSLKLLTYQYKEMQGGMNVLIQLLRGKWEEHVCQCGRINNVLSFEERRRSRGWDPQRLVENIDGEEMSMMEVNDIEQNVKPINSESRNNSSSSDNDSDAVIEKKCENSIETEKKNPSNSSVIEKCEVSTQTEKKVTRENCTQNDRKLLIENGTETYNYTETREASTNTAKYNYTDGQLKRIGQLQPMWETYGPVECLNDSGGWEFQLSDHWTDEWTAICEMRNVKMCGRLLLLPVEFGGGLCITVELRGLMTSSSSLSLSTNANTNHRLFQISLNVPNIDYNFQVALPLEVRVKVRIRLIDGSYHQSDWHTFQFNRLYSVAQPDNFLVSFSGTRIDRIPEMIFLFEKIKD